ncbi:MAG: zinc ribbon domain-containing protein [Lachnospiraceae bacterium]|nr:zinc ribbon domain-containing protein [Lachnospiraceae bacterium]
MAYCLQCGKELEEGAKYCSGCGAKTLSENESEKGRKIVYEGEVHKCPSCGEILNSFTSHCPSCGYELRGAKVANSVREFSQQLSSTDSESQKEIIIRSFPIPNTKEDILEFIVLASANIESDVEGEISVAWQVKFEQAYQKADMLFKNEAIFEKIQKIYDTTNEKIIKNKKIKNMRDVRKRISALMPVMPNLLVIIVWMISIFILIPLSGLAFAGIESTGYKMVLLLDLIIGVFLIPPFIKSKSELPRIVTITGLTLLLLLLVILHKISDGSGGHGIIIFVDIVCSILIVRKMLRNKPEMTMKHGSTSVVVTIGVLIILIITYLVSGLFVSLRKSNTTNKGDSTASSDSSLQTEKQNYFEWPNSGLSLLLPKLDTNNGEIHFNDDEEFWVDIEGISQSEYECYIEECKEKGFTVDGTKTNMQYEAYNEEGYYLCLMYLDSWEELDIHITVPRASEELIWPSIGLAKLIPKPNGTKGKIEIENHSQLCVYVGETSKDDYLTYVDACIEKGFTIDYSRSDTVFSADNKKGDSLRVEYVGNNIMRISIYASDDD